MHGYLRAVTKSSDLDRAPDLEAKLRACVISAPGIKAVTGIKPDPRGGFSITVDREELLPEDLEAYFNRSDFLLVI